MEYIFILLSTLFFAVDFCFDKVYQKNAGNSLYAGFKYNLIVGIAGAVMFFAVNGFRIECTIFSAVIALSCAAIVAAYKILGMMILKEGSIAIYTMFLMSGGMIVPYIWGLLFLNEAFSVYKFIGIIIITAAVIVSYYGKGKFSKKQLILCIIVFVINGFTSVLSKIHQIQTVYPVVSTVNFSLISNIARFLISGILLIFIKKEKEYVFPAKKVYPVMILSAVFGGFASFFNVSAAKSVPATMLYPLITGGVILFSAIAARVVFKEKITKKLSVGIALCIAGVLFFAI